MMNEVDTLKDQAWTANAAQDWEKLGAILGTLERIDASAVRDFYPQLQQSAASRGAPSSITDILDEKVTAMNTAHAETAETPTLSAVLAGEVSPEAETKTEPETEPTPDPEPEPAADAPAAASSFIVKSGFWYMRRTTFTGDLALADRFDSVAAASAALAKNAKYMKAASRKAAVVVALDEAGAVADAPKGENPKRGARSTVAKPAAKSTKKAPAAAAKPDPAVGSPTKFVNAFTRTFAQLLGPFDYKQDVTGEEPGKIVFVSGDIRVELINPGKAGGSAVAPYSVTRKRGKPVTGAGRNALADQLGVPRLARK